MYQSSQSSTDTDSEMEQVQFSHLKPQTQIQLLIDELENKQYELQRLASEYKLKINEQRGLNKLNQQFLKKDLEHQFKTRQRRFRFQAETELRTQKSELKKQLQKDFRIREEQFKMQKLTINQEMEKRLRQYYEMKWKKQQTQLKEENRELSAREQLHIRKIEQLSQALNRANRRNQAQQKQFSALKAKVSTDLSAVKKYLDDDKQRKNKNNE